MTAPAAAFFFPNTINSLTNSEIIRFENHQKITEKPTVSLILVHNSAF